MSIKVTTYDRSAPIPDDVRSAIESAKFRVEYSGGLGDIVYQIHHNDAYESLIALRLGEVGAVVLACHNPHARELFDSIKTDGHVVVANVGFEDLWNRVWRSRVGLPGDKPPGWRERAEIKPVPINSLPSDIPALQELEKIKPFVILAASGSCPSKSLPEDVASSIADTVISSGGRVVTIGRTYRMFIGGEQSEPHTEVRIRPRPGLTDMIDRLSVPGLSAAMNLSSGVISPNTATLLLSYCQWRPTLFVAHEFDWKTFIPDAPAGYMFRLKEKGNSYLRLSEYSEGDVRSFLGLIFS